MSNYSYGSPQTTTGLSDPLAQSVQLTITSLPALATIYARVTPIIGAPFLVEITAPGTYDYALASGIEVVLSPTYNAPFEAGSIAGTLRTFLAGLVPIQSASFNDSVTVTVNNSFPRDYVGTAGDDLLIGDGNANRVVGLDGNDTLRGNGGGDTLNGGAGFDIADYSTTSAAVKVTIGGSLGGAAAGDTLISIEGVEGSAFADTLVGDGNANVLNGGAGNDTLIGGGGDDTYVVDSAGDSVVENPGEGYDRILTSVSYALAAGSDIELLSTLRQNGTEAIDLTGNAIAQNLTGNEGVNALDGGGGNDVLYGLGGNDFLNGGSGADQLYGGTGNDTYIVDNAGDSVIENVGEGNDRVLTTVSYSLATAAEIELLSTYDQTGTALINLVGNDYAQAVIGNEGANTLEGRGGNDTLYGLGGNDLLDGGTGADQLIGGTGDDTYAVDNAGDIVYENAGEGSDRVLTTVSYQLSVGSSIELLSSADQAGTSAVNLTGNDLSQSVIGNDGTNALYGLGGVDTLYGLGGDDLLDGGLGADQLYGGSGADRFAFSTALGGDNVDRIADFASGVDRIQLSQSVFTALGLGSIAAGQFVAGTTAGDADDRIIYDSASGTIWYDADGNGSGAAVAFAQLTPGATLIASDFVVA